MVYEVQQMCQNHIVLKQFHVLLYKRTAVDYQYSFPALKKHE